jgi:hypothetical protein
VDTGVPRVAGRAPALPAVPFFADVTTGRLESVTGAFRAAGLVLECEVVAAGCDPPVDPLPPK